MDWSCFAVPVRNNHWCNIPCLMDQACTSGMLVAAGLALMAISATCLAAEGPSLALALYNISAVSEHREVQRASMKASTTSRPRREESVYGLAVSLDDVPS